MNDVRPKQLEVGVVKNKSAQDHLTMRVSHETIYQSLFVQARGTLGKELTAYLRTRIRRKPHGHAPAVGERPDLVEVMGHHLVDAVGGGLREDGGRGQ